MSIENINIKPFFRVSHNNEFNTNVVMTMINNR